MLCELAIVALFLALSAVTLLRLFAASNNISRDSAALTRATILAQDALECFTAGEMPPERADTPSKARHTLCSAKYKPKSVMQAPWKRAQ